MGNGGRKSWRGTGQGIPWPGSSDDERAWRSIGVTPNQNPSSDDRPAMPQKRKKLHANRCPRNRARYTRTNDICLIIFQLSRVLERIASTGPKMPKKKGSNQHRISWSVATSRNAFEDGAAKQGVYSGREILKTSSLAKSLTKTRPVVIRLENFSNSLAHRF